MLSLNNLKLPEKFGCLKKLQDLRLDNSKLCELPESFENLTELKILDFYCNNLKFLPPSISEMKNLQCLYLNKNEFESTANEVLRRFYQAGTYAVSHSNATCSNKNKNDIELKSVQLKTNAEGKQDVTSKELLGVIAFSPHMRCSFDMKHTDSTEGDEIVDKQNFKCISSYGKPFFYNCCPKQNLCTQNYSASEIPAVEDWEDGIGHDDVSSCSDACPEQDVCVHNAVNQEASVLDIAYECWDNEIPIENFHDDSCNTENKASSDSEDWDSEAIFESTDGRVGIHKHPSSHKENMFFFLPAEVHPVSVQRNSILWFCADDGQFDDADS